MKRRIRAIFFSTTGLLAVVLTPALYDTLATSPYDAPYLIPSIKCACGHSAYLRFHGPKCIWWTPGHNSSVESYYVRPGPSPNRFELHDWEQKHGGWVEFHWLWIDFQMDGYPQTKIYREFNWIRLCLEKRQGKSEEYRYETLEEIEQKIIEHRKRKEPNIKGPPNSGASPVRIHIANPEWLPLIVRQ